MNTAILLGGGNGTRFGGDKNLEYIGDHPVARYSLMAFSACAEIDNIIIVSSQKNSLSFQEISTDFPKVSATIVGGKNRYNSAKKGFEETEKDNCDTIVFHNLANPFVTEEEILSVLDSAKKNGAAGVAHTLSSTLRTSDGKTLPREKIFAMETPQAVQREIFEKGISCIEEKKKNEADITDDLCVAEKAGVIPEILPASRYNKKITFAEDLEYFRSLFGKKHDIFLPEQVKNIAVGLGQDSHRFSNSGTLILGGIEIENAPKLLANSDGDAVLHAVINAISSAMGGGSLSSFADDMCKNGTTDSAEYAKVIMEKLQKKNSEITHISISIEAKKPKLEIYFDRMKKRLSEIFSVSEKSIGITATTGEEMSDFGRGKGISVWASITLAFEER